ncbi:hypothetical protein EV652_12047 [Kribbella steppae]|uniref:Uncharacterized protein n=1 Tax=Kribbella steppae TaxID=2512223 RepID=A0A4R2H179_9ACTN|nr:hypothetical protein EV652_12047 [Kribbella steppae]
MAGGLGEELCADQWVLVRSGDPGLLPAVVKWLDPEVFVAEGGQFVQFVQLSVALGRDELAPVAHRSTL